MRQEAADQGRGSTIVPSGRAGFTLVELLVTLAIVGILIALVLPMMRGSVAASRGFRCSMSMRSVAFDFQMFADSRLHGDRGNDAVELPSGQFRLETFLHAQYRVNEYWAYGDEQLARLPDTSGYDPMRCPEVKSEVILSKWICCMDGAVGPEESVSYGFNIRLHFSEKMASRGRSPTITLTESVLDGMGLASPSAIPLLWDVNGQGAAQNGVSPVLSGPSLGSTLLFGDDRYWWPSPRHNRSMNVGFIDGHVDTTRVPLSEAWEWGFEPVR